MIPLKNFSADEKQKILTVLNECEGRYEKAVRRLNIPERYVQQVDMTENKKWNFTPEGKGRPELQKYLIATRDVNQKWDIHDEKIKKARYLYDRGDVELVTGRDGFNIILYAIPRRVKAVRSKPYFTAPMLEVVGEEDDE